MERASHGQDTRGIGHTEGQAEDKVRPGRTEERTYGRTGGQDAKRGQGEVKGQRRKEDIMLLKVGQRET